MTNDQTLQDAVDVGPVSAVRPAQKPTATTVVDVMAPGPRRVDHPSFVYALGRIEPRFPSLSVEKEFAQAVARAGTAGLNDRQTFRATISERHNRYLARSLCWVLVISRLETYILLPRDPMDVDLLIDSYREDARRDDLDVVIGLRGQIAPPEMCNGLAVPIVVFDQIYSFDRDALVGSIPRPAAIRRRATRSSVRMRDRSRTMNRPGRRGGRGIDLVDATIGTANVAVGRSRHAGHRDADPPDSCLSADPRPSDPAGSVRLQRLDDPRPSRGCARR